jgi:ABC-type glucose/galactose transport system permease subunit
MRIIGAAEGVIMATIITAHMTYVREKSLTPQACIRGMAISVTVSMFCISAAKEDT